MESKFILSCESTIDTPYDYWQNRDISVFPYIYDYNGIKYLSCKWRNADSGAAFNDFLRSGIIPEASTPTKEEYVSYFEELLQHGDLLHIVLGAGLTKSMQNALAAMNELRSRHPHRSILVVDSLCNTSAYAFMIDYAADLRDEGRTMTDIQQWILTYKQCIKDTYIQIKPNKFTQSGRISSITAIVSAVLNICPIIRLDARRKIAASSKKLIKRDAIKNTVDAVSRELKNRFDYDGRCYIFHSNSIENALTTQDRIEELFPKLVNKVLIFNVGSIITSYYAPGSVDLFFISIRGHEYKA